MITRVREILGLDPLYVANEGKLLAILPLKMPIASCRFCAHILWGEIRL